MAHVGEVQYLAADPLCRGLEQIASIRALSPVLATAI
jgi:hypothetical protein